MSSYRDSLWLFAQAAVIQVAVGAPFGIGDFGAVLATTGHGAVAWIVAYAFGCYRALGVPFVLGGMLIGMTRQGGRAGAILLVGLPTSLAAGIYLPHVLSAVKGVPTLGHTLGGVGALWMLSTMVTMVGFAMGRIFAQPRGKELEA